MRREDSHVARLRVWIIEWNILLHRQMQGLFLVIGRGSWIFPDVLSGHGVLNDAKRRHFARLLFEKGNLGGLSF